MPEHADATHERGITADHVTTVACDIRNVGFGECSGPGIDNRDAEASPNE